MNKINESGKVTFGQAWKDFWTGYFDFKGTSTRSGFWWGVFDYFIIYFIFQIICSMVNSYNRNVLFSIELDKSLTFIMAIIHLVIFIPLLSVLSRRLRDTGMKEKLVMFLLITYTIILIIITALLLTMFSKPVIGIVTLTNLVLVIIFAILGCMPTGKFNK